MSTEQMGSELYHRCYDYIVSYSCKPTSTKAVWDFPAYADFHYGLDSFSIRFGRENRVYVEYEAGACSSGWYTCHTFEDFSKIFDAFALSCFDPQLLVHGLKSLSFGNCGSPVGGSGVVKTFPDGGNNLPVVSDKVELEGVGL